MRSSLSLLAIAAGLAACGGSTSADLAADSSDAAADGLATGDAAGHDAAPLGDGGCLAVEPNEGDPCTPGQSVCSSGGNVCCIGYVWTCDSSTEQWKKLGVGCACSAGNGPFACGKTLTCNGGQYCVDHPPGIAFDGGAPPDSFECVDVPPACAVSPSCACIKSQLSPSQCQVDSCTEDAGAVTIGCLGI